ncbi:MAG: protein phosphatase 2C domain-containing protein [Actinobacteria bacterium]|nr:protein phosphatase 2C domain-containing protein [Actinomycetota bacterium]MDA2982077.1 protein phosphatase 2C domain-containing protein [Actinomycetota bacterium]MDA2997127.1 protein phosphatase 2C domain-containing protein [Actinomycetota bacterium]
MSKSSLAFKVFALSDLGLVREGNEDSGMVSSELVAVADGMGGHAGGEVASKIAISALTAKRIDVASLLAVTKEIDLAILDRSNAQPELAGMGTTLTALHLTEGSVGLLHVGDSRCYAFTDGKLNQLSIDHTVMQELIDQGRITPDEAVNHPQRSLLTHALMGDSGFEPSVQLYPVKLGDQFLLCSDGLTGVLSDLEITKIIRKYSGQELVENLVSETRAKGAPDNVTVIWAEVVLEEDASSTALIGAANA